MVYIRNIFFEYSINKKTISYTSKEVDGTGVSAPQTYEGCAPDGAPLRRPQQGNTLSHFQIGLTQPRSHSRTSRSGDWLYLKILIKRSTGFITLKSSPY